MIEMKGVVRQADQVRRLNKCVERGLLLCCEQRKKLDETTYEGCFGTSGISLITIPSFCKGLEHFFNLPEDALCCTILFCALRTEWTELFESSTQWDVYYPVPSCRVIHMNDIHFVWSWLSHEWYMIGQKHIVCFCFLWVYMHWSLSSWNKSWPFCMVKAWK